MKKLYLTCSLLALSILGSLSYAPPVYACDLEGPNNQVVRTYASSFYTITVTYIIDPCGGIVSSSATLFE